jgi:hypothetical protein
MRKIFLGILVMALAVMFASPATALGPPENLDVSVSGGFVTFSWDPVDGADKYSVDVIVGVDSDVDGVEDMTVQFSFGTSDRTDGYGMEEPFLSVPLDEFVFDINDDDILEQVAGSALAMVKALSPGKGKGRQNYRFSVPYRFMLPMP